MAAVPLRFKMLGKLWSNWGQSGRESAEASTPLTTAKVPLSTYLSHLIGPLELPGGVQQQKTEELFN